tara:strand:+ start:40286 stop:40468 length:183 start_codon:yes stop_codon:yes gene_type:complete
VKVHTINANSAELVIEAIKEALVPHFCVGSDGSLNPEAAQVVNHGKLELNLSMDKIAQLT